RHPAPATPGPHPHRPGAAGAAYRRLRDGHRHPAPEPRPVRQAARRRAHGTGAACAEPLGQARQQDHVALGRHEAARADRQGADPRAQHPVPGRAHRRRRRRAAPGHVEAGARAARTGHHHHPHHPLHRGGRGDGRPGRRDQPRPADSGGGQGDADAQARPQAADPAAAVAAGGHPAGTGRAADRAFRRRSDPGLHLRHPGRAHRHRRPAAAAVGARHRLPRPQHLGEFAGGDLRQPGAPARAGGGRGMNWYGIRAIYRFEMARTFRTLGESILSPVLTTSLYFIVFGAAIGSRMGDIDGISYGAFIIPGLVMLSILSESISNAAFGIYMPKWAGTIFELLSAPVGWGEAVLGYVGAAATKSLILGALILLTARFFVDYEVQHPAAMLLFLVLTAVSFSLFGFVIGLWATDFQKLQIIPLMVVTPLTFLG